MPDTDSDSYLKKNWLGHASGNGDAMALKLPAGISLLAAIRADLKHLDPQQLEDRVVIRSWWESGGFRDYPHIEWPLSAAEIEELRLVTLSDAFARGGNGLSAALKGNGPCVLDLMPSFSMHRCEMVIDPQAVAIELPPTLMLIWRDRADLQTMHDVNLRQGRLSLLRWWFLFGHQEYLRVRWSLTPSWLALGEHPLKESVPLPTFLSCLIAARDDLGSQFHLDTEAGRLAALLWWAQHGCAEYGVPSWALSWHTPLRRILSNRADAFNSDEVDEKDRPAQRLAFLPFFVRQMRPDLVSAFNTQSRSGCDQLLAWWKTIGKNEYQAFAALIAPPDARAAGLNIVGYAQSVIGIAEDVRMAARSAETADVPFCVIDAPMPGPKRSEHSLDAHLVELPVHPVSLYCLPPPEIFRLGMEGKRRLLNSGTYNIGGMHWELPSWPAHLAGVTEAVNEIWVYTEFVRDAFAPLTEKPVIKMPLAVELPKHAGHSRAAFGLPKESFLFLLMFDGNSWLTRKNPIAAVRAFRKAFAGNRHVGLVIKAISLDRESAGWKEVEREIHGDERVKIIDESLDRPTLTQLMASCDAYVSLHRSEGFGRIIAEAMLLGIPTVTTNFSGNTEFCTVDTSYLVDGPLIGLKKGDYLFADDQHWCDPDVDQAAQQMQRLFEDKNHSKHLVDAARTNIQSNFSVSAAGAAYRSRLLALRADGHI